MRARLLVTLLATCGLLPGCNKDEPAADEPVAPPASARPAEAPAPPAPPTGAPTVRGSVAGNQLALATGVYAWRPGADDMQLFLSDRADLCDVLAAGALPKSSQVLFVTLKLTASDNRDGPFRAGRYPVRTGDPIEPQETKRARYLKLDATCDTAAGQLATGGAVELSTETVAPTGTIAGTLSLELGADRLAGGFTATACTLPEDEPSAGCR